MHSSVKRKIVWIFLLIHSDSSFLDDERRDNEKNGKFFDTPYTQQTNFSAVEQPGSMEVKLVFTI